MTIGGWRRIREDGGIYLLISTILVTKMMRKFSQVAVEGSGRVCELVDNSIYSAEEDFGCMAVI